MQRILGIIRCIFYYLEPLHSSRTAPKNLSYRLLIKKTFYLFVKKEDFFSFF